jgi:putative peptidoglycan lipid II flippase
MKLVRAVATVSGFTMLSRVLGLVRDMAIAAFLGAGPAADAFFVAFKFPNFFRRLFAEGAFNAAFVPIFSRLYIAEGLVSARQYAEQIFAILLTILLIFVGIVEGALPWLMYILAPGFADDPVQFALTLSLTRVTFPYILFISLAAFYSGILNSLGQFSAAAASPILLNVAMVVALLMGHHLGWMPEWALAWAVLLAGMLQLWWVQWACHQTVKVQLSRPRFTPVVRQLLRAMGPGALGAGITQVNLLVDTMLASFLPAGAVSYLYYADRLNQLPLSLLGIGLSTALLPLLSQRFEQGDTAAVHNLQNRALEFTLALTLPAALALIVLAFPIISILFERAEFNTDDVQQTAYVLAALSCGLPAYVLTKVFTTSFFAQYNTKTPVLIAVSSVIVNIVLNLLLIKPFQQVGIAAATAITAWLNAGVLALRLHRSGALILDQRLKTRLPRMALAATGMAGIVYSLYRYVLFAPEELLILRGLKLGFLVISGAGVYLLLACGLKALEWAEMKNLMRRQPQPLSPTERTVSL